MCFTRKRFTYGFGKSVITVHNLIFVLFASVAIVRFGGEKKLIANKSMEQ